MGVHVAARVGALAVGGEILATAETLAEAGDPPASDPRTTPVKGVAAPVSVAGDRLGVTLDRRPGPREPGCSVGRRGHRTHARGRAFTTYSRDRWTDRRQARLPEPWLLEEGPHRPPDRRRRDRVRRAPSRPDRRGAHERQHRDRPRDRLRGARPSIRRRHVGRKQSRARPDDASPRGRSRPRRAGCGLSARPGQRR